MPDSNDQAMPYTVAKVETVKSDVIDPIDYAYQGTRDITITIRQPEFTSVCPMTGLPDYGTIILRYMPNEKIVELKSWKYYLLQYRNVGIFYEHLVNRILEDLVSTLAPKWLEVQGLFTSRGGISSEVTAQFNMDSPKD